LEASSVGFDPSNASVVSGRHEQAAQIFGLREKLLPFSTMGWPQQMQTRIRISADFRSK
jgi:hypothetical protein